MINGTYAEQAEGLRFLQGNPLGHQLTKHQVKISQDDGHHNACQGLAVGQVPLRHPYRQHLGDTGSRRRTGEKACQSDGHLDGGQEHRRVLHQALYERCVFVSLLGQAVYLVLVNRYHCHLGACKECID